MTVAEMRTLVANLPDDMPIVVRSNGEGYDPEMAIAVRRLAPSRCPSRSGGVLKDEHVVWAAARAHLAIGVTDATAGMPARLAAAHIDGW